MKPIPIVFQNLEVSKSWRQRLSRIKATPYQGDRSDAEKKQILKHDRYKPKVSLFPVYFVLFIDNFAYAVIFSIFGPLFVDSSFGMVTAAMSSTIKNLMLGLALCCFPLGQLIGAPLIGDIADQFGRKKAFYITILGGVFGMALTGLSVMSHSFILLILLRLITGFFSGNLSICLASIADLSRDEKTRAKNFSIIVIITGISWMFAILSGSYLSNPSVYSGFNPTIPFFITAILSFLSFLAIAGFFKETHPMKAKFKIDFLKGFRDVTSTFKIKQLHLLYPVLMLWLLGWGIAFQWYNPYALQRFKISSIEINWGLLIVGLTWMFGGYHINNLILKRWHPLPWIVVANAMTSLCLLGMALSSSFFPFSIAFLIGCIPSAFAWPNTLNLISINAPPSVQGKVMGISQSAQSMGQILGTILGGIIAATIMNGLYYFAMGSLFLSFVLIFYFHKKKPHYQKNNAA